MGALLFSGAGQTSFPEKEIFPAPELSPFSRKAKNFVPRFFMSAICNPLAGVIYRLAMDHK